MNRRLRMGVLPLLPSFPLLCFLTTLHRRKTISNAFIHTGNLYRFGIVVDGSNINPRAMNCSTLIPNQCFVGNRRMITQILLLVRNFLRNSMNIIEVLTTMYTTISERRANTGRRLYVGKASSFRLHRCIKDMWNNKILRRFIRV